MEYSQECLITMYGAKGVCEILGKYFLKLYDSPTTTLCACNEYRIISNFKKGISSL